MRQRAAKQVGMAILLSTLTTICILLPFQFVDVGGLRANHYRFGPAFDVEFIGQFGHRLGGNPHRL